MKEFFKQQLESANPITQELLDEIPTKNYDSGEPKEAGDYVLYAFKNQFEPNETTGAETFGLTLFSLCEREFDYYAERYTPLSPSFAGQMTIPIFVLKGDEEKYKIMWDEHVKSL